MAQDGNRDGLGDPCQTRRVDTNVARPSESAGELSNFPETATVNRAWPDTEPTVSRASASKARNVGSGHHVDGPTAFSSSRGELQSVDITDAVSDW